MCRWQLGFDIWIRLSLHWFVLLQGTGRFSKMTSTMLMWYSEKLFRSVVGPPAATDWSRPWHEILHVWNARVAQFVQQYSVRCWSVRCVEVHWNLAQYAANLPPDRWLSRILMWTCRGHHTVGRPRNTWDTTLQNFCRHQHLGNWRAVARDTNRWANLMPQFVLFCTES